jgi:transcriptional regulator with XRE-family HTH domain
MLRGWTQQEVADLCTRRGAPVSDVNVSAIERGLWKPRPKLRAVLAELLDLPITFFDERSDVTS